MGKAPRPVTIVGMPYADLPDEQRTATPVRGTRIATSDVQGRDVARVTVRAPRGKRRRRTKRRHTVLRAVLITLVSLCMIAGLGGIYLYRHLSGNLHVEDVTQEIVGARPARTFPEGPHEPLNILVMGEDSRDCKGCDIDGLTQDGARSDTTILVHLSADRKHAYGISIPRDSMVTRPECKTSTGSISPEESDQMWNAAFAIGGPACTISQVEHITGIHIDHFVVVNFESFQGMVDAIGGVTVCLPEPVKDPLAQLNLPAGTQVLTGRNALGYVRERHAIGDGSDLGRVQRQQAFISAMIKQVMTAGTLANPVHLIKFLDAATKGLTVDPGLGDIKKLASLAYGFRDIGLNKIQFITVPWEYDPADPNRVIWTSQAGAVWTAIKNDQPLTKQLTATALNADDAPGGKAPKKSGGATGAKKGSSDLTAQKKQQMSQAGLCT